VEDMFARGALFAHTGQYCDGDASCIFGFADAKKRVDDRLGLRHCASEIRAFAGDLGDMFYTNFVAMRTRLFTDPQALAFMRELWKDHGWWRGRWGDQIAIHHVLGLLLADPFRHIVDYSQFRCVYRRFDETAPPDGVWRQPEIWYNLQPEDNATFQDHCAGATFHHGRLEYKWHEPPQRRQKRPPRWEIAPNTNRTRIYALEPVICENGRFK
jgi:hypothetical protein